MPLILSSCAIQRLLFKTPIIQAIAPFPRDQAPSPRIEQEALPVKIQEATNSTSLYRSSTTNERLLVYE
ncbi:MAG: hypothetical protein KBH75_00695 [Saprospiraceae bacterium]|nr:hypothetical protein [Saprospiraceae bacterium]